MRALGRSLAFAAFTTLATCSLVTAQNPATSGPAIPSGGGVIQGRVVDSASEMPIGVATVGFTDAKAAALVSRTTTGPGGGFRVQGLRPGRYRVRVIAIG